VTDVPSSRLGGLVISLDHLRQPVRGQDRTPGPYPYYGASGIVDYVDNYIFEGLHLLIAEDGENLRTRKTPIAFLADGQFWVNNHAHVVRGNDLADTRYLSYAVEAADISGYLTGSTQPKLTKESLLKIEVPAPVLSEQRAIAGVLGALDDKIETNGRMSQITVDLMITTWQLYASTSQPGKIGGLVSNSTVRVGDRTADVVVLSATAAGQLVRSDEFFKKQVYSKNISKYLLVPPWSFAYNPSRANIGSIGLNVGPETGAVSPVYVVAQAAGPAESWWLELALRTESVRNDIAAFSSGSVRQVLRFHDLASIGIPLPDSTQLRSFFSELSPLIEVRQRNEKESGALAALRDALLPELLSGRLRVRDAEKAVEGVV